jgi:hypothetical protein
MDHETQTLTPEELIVYEAVATLRHTSADALVAGTELPEQTVAAALRELGDHGMVELRDGGVHLGPNDWDVPNARG